MKRQRQTEKIEEGTPRTGRKIAAEKRSESKSISDFGLKLLRTSAREYRAHFLDTCRYVST